MSAAKLTGIVMEIEDAGYALLDNLLATTDADKAFVDAGVVVLLGGFPRLPGMERKDLLIKNAECIQAQARSLNNYGNRYTKILVVANPANTNCLVAIKSAPNIPACNFTCLTRLDQERLRFLCAKKASELTNNTVKASEVMDAFIWGNHSTTQVVYTDSAYFIDSDGNTQKLSDIFCPADDEEILKRVQNRGAEIIQALQVSSALSAAEAIAKHLQDWLSDRPATFSFSMGVLATGNTYGINEDIVFSFPCTRGRDSGSYEVITGLEVSANMRRLLDASVAELLDERHKVKDYLA
jgi:malate dehydrogenase